jgi:hypothetical protein
METTPFRTSRLLSCAALALFAWAGPSAGSAMAGYQSASFIFNVSNVLPPSDYGTVLLESYTGPGTVNGLSNGQVRFTVDAPFLPIYGDPTQAPNFGMDKFAFNTDLSPIPTSIVVATSSNPNLGWGIKEDQNISNFGTFEVEDKGTGHSRGDPITVTISGLGSNATLNHFIFLSDGNGGSTPAYFTAHLGGFPNQPTSQYIAVTDITQTPAPPGLALALAGIGSLGIGGLCRLWRRVLV